MSAQTLAPGQVHKIVRIVGTSPVSWEDAAQVAVVEAAQTIHGLSTAEVVEADLYLHDGHVQYRVKLETMFQLDRSRISEGGTTYDVRRYLIIANQTLPSPALRELVAERNSVGSAEFHVLVPMAPLPKPPYVEPMGSDLAVAPTIEEEANARQEAEDRLTDFRQQFAELGPNLRGEVGSDDPIEAARRVFEYATFDEIIVSTLPAKLSRWLRMDLPSRLERAFNVPVIPLIQDDQ